VGGGVTTDSGPGPAEATPDEETLRIVRFDAGWMGCDRMPMVERRQLQAVEIGDVVEFVVYDPSSKEDVPSFARMLGHRVRWIREQDDGAALIAVQRMR
jgi:TusA-related sulfurtransferase